MRRVPLLLALFIIGSAFSLAVFLLMLLYYRENQPPRWWRIP